MPFGMWTQAGLKKYVLDGVTLAQTIANTTEPSVCGGDAALCQVTLATCYHFISRICQITTFSSFQPLVILTSHIYRLQSLYSEKIIHPAFGLVCVSVCLFILTLTLN